MSKSKKPSGNKFIDSVLSELKDEENAPVRDQITSSEQRNILLDKFRGKKETAKKEETVFQIDSADDSGINAPEGLISDKTTVQAQPLKKEVPDERPQEFKTSELPSIPHTYPDESVTIPLQTHETREAAQSSSTSTNQGPITDQTQPLNSNKGRGQQDQSVKISYGAGRVGGRSPSSPAGQTSDMQLVQAENLKLAQARITELEKEIERLRNENELLSSAGSIARQRSDELTEKIHEIERARVDAIERAEMEMKVVRDSLSDKTRELNKARKKIEELESRMTTDVRKIRVRERELENRLELARLEKTALVRSKDETILDLKRNLDVMAMELESHKQRASDLQSKIDEQQEQLGRTVRALRLALTNLESSDSTSGQLVPLKKAE